MTVFLSIYLRTANSIASDTQQLSLGMKGGNGDKPSLKLVMKNKVHVFIII